MSDARARGRLALTLGVWVAAALLLLRICQANRLAETNERLQRRVDELERGAARGSKERAGAAGEHGTGAPRSPEERARRIAALRRDRDVDLLAGAYEGALVPADHSAFDGRGGDGIPPLELGRRGGTLRVALRGDVDGFNPITSKSLASFGLLFQVFDPLFFADPWTLELLPRLAVGYDVSDDLLDWTIHLRPGVRWADGVPFTADDVLFTYDLMRRPDVVSYSSREYDYDVDGARVPVTWSKVDDLTVRFHQPLPYPAFPNKLAFRLIVPAHALRAAAESGAFQRHWGVGTSDFSTHVGTGPFRIARHQAGARVIVERNPLYWGRDRAGAPLPYLDSIVFEELEGADVPYLRFQAGELDLLGDVPAPLVPLLEESARDGGGRGDGVRCFDIGTDIGWVYLLLNQNTGVVEGTTRPCVAPHKLAWFRDRRFREALSLALDRAALVDLAYLGLARPGGPVYNEACGVFHDPGLEAGGHDPAQAAALLDELGLRDRDSDGVREDAQGRPVELSLGWYERTPDLTTVAGIVADQLGAAGVRVRLDVMDATRFSSALFERHEFEALLGEDSSGIGLPCGDHPLFSSTTEYHLWFPKQPTPSTEWEAQVDRLFRAASLEREPERVVGLLNEFQAILAREQPLLFLASKVRSMACRRRLRNFRPAPLEPAVFWTAQEMFFAE
jgi:peptide/nickel transport system substrate-binding protein